MLQLKIGSSEFLGMGLFLVLVLIEIFLYCYFGTEIQNEVSFT